MESINEKIKRIRLETGVNQADVARSAGIKQSSYASIEKGDTKSISIEVGKGIAKALNISFNELFEIETNNEKITKLKDLVFKSMHEFRFNREHFKMEELIDRYGNDNWVEKGADELMNYHAMIRDFDWGLMETLINMGFCTREEFRSYNIKAYSRIDSGKTEAELYAEIREDIKNSAKEKGLPYP